MNRKLTQALICTIPLSLLSIPTLAATPVIASAALSDGTISISGSNFGTKATAAPYRWYPLQSNADGQTGRQVGLEQYNYDEPEMTVSSSLMFNGSKSLYRFVQGSTGSVTSGSFPHLGVIMPANNNEIFTSFWMRLSTRQNMDISGSMSPQIKMPRAGVKVSNTDGASNYAVTSAKYLPSMYFHPNGTWIDPTTGTNQDSSGRAAYIASQWTNGAGQYFEYDAQWTAPPSSFNMLNQWVSVQLYYKFNDVGVANGVERVWMGGKLVMEKTNAQPRTAAGQNLDQIQVLTGIAFLNKVDWDWYITKIYVDTTAANVFLCNSATLASCTGRYNLPPKSWSGSSITVGDATTIPSGYKWVYVTNSAGETNSTGFTLTTATTTAPPVAPTIQAITTN